MRIGSPRYCGIGFVFFVVAMYIYVVSLGLSSSSDEYHCSHSCLGTGMRVGKNTFVIVVHIWSTGIRDSSLSALLN